MAPQAQQCTIKDIKKYLGNGNDDAAIDLIYCRIKNVFETNNNLKARDIFATRNQVKQYRSYEESYKPIVENFECLIKQNPCNEKWLILGASLVYSWMPTIFTLYKRRKKIDVLCSLQNIKNNSKNVKKELADKHCSQIVSEIASICEIASLRNCINNSIRGTSKFLHFSCPKVFPIWDKRVAKAVYECEYREAIFTADKQHNKDISHYVAYAKAVHKVYEDGDLPPPLNTMCLLKNKKGIRKIEHALFLIGGMYMEQEKARKKMEKEAKNK